MIYARDGRSCSLIRVAIAFTELVFGRVGSIGSFDGGNLAWVSNMDSSKAEEQQGCYSGAWENQVY